jgi:two-component system phosphate regulon response regulator PhoB
MQAEIRRKFSNEPLDDLVIDVGRHEVRWQGRLVRVGPQDFSLLSVLARRPIRAWTFEELLRLVWRDEHERDTGNVRMAIRRLRQRLERARVPVRIQSVYGYGFILLADAQHNDARP